MNLKHLHTPKQENKNFDKSFSHRNKLVAKKHEEILHEMNDERQDDIKRAMILIAICTAALVLISYL